MSDLVVKLAVHWFVHSFEVHFSHLSKYDILNDIRTCSWSVCHLLVNVLRHKILWEWHTRKWDLLELRRGQSSELGLGGHDVGSLGHLELLRHDVEVILVGRGIAVVAALQTLFSAKTLRVVFISLCYLIKAF